MKKINLTLILILTLFIIPKPKAVGQTIPISLVACSTLSDLRVQPPQSNQLITLMGLSAANDGNGGQYYWNPTSTIADDGFVNIQVTGITTGRWTRIGNGNTYRGTFTSFAAVSLQTSYTVSFGQTFPFVPKDVIFIAKSTNAGLGYSIGAITNSTFVIIFNSVPVLGTITGDFVIIKQ